MRTRSCIHPTLFFLLLSIAYIYINGIRFATAAGLAASIDSTGGYGPALIRVLPQIRSPFSQFYSK